VAVRDDGFQVDTEDPRFAALWSSDFAIDPTSSKFMRTPAMKKVLEVRRQKSKQREETEEHDAIAGKKQEHINSQSLSSLVASLKRKSSHGGESVTKKPKG
jgi:hypothetical protein